MHEVHKSKTTRTSHLVSINRTGTDLSKCPEHTFKPLLTVTGIKAAHIYARVSRRTRDKPFHQDTIAQQLNRSLHNCFFRSRRSLELDKAVGTAFAWLYAEGVDGTKGGEGFTQLGLCDFVREVAEVEGFAEIFRGGRGLSSLDGSGHATISLER
jgi:hypothetical protein